MTYLERKAFSPTHDCYDVFATRFGVMSRVLYYRRNIFGYATAGAVALLDFLFPETIRILFGLRKRNYPILTAHEFLTLAIEGESGNIYSRALRRFFEQIVKGPDWVAWGLGFPWMSKNGLYGPDVPFVTHTPYVMEALLKIAEDKHCHPEAMELFHATWGFLEALKVMAEDGETLALSYAPVNEPRIVVNANAYAAFAYALHAIHGLDGVRARAQDKAVRLARWVMRQQEESGRWWYYADQGAGNFVDCFHSCFVVKNLIKVRRLLPDVAAFVNPAIEKGWNFIRSAFYDPKSGLCRRFVARSHRDPYRWDLYDQAEYLGLLVDFGLLKEAQKFAAHVEHRFRKGRDWYCRIDVFGRRWGRNFMRWGIAPFLYHKARLDQVVKGGA